MLLLWAAEDDDDEDGGRQRLELVGDLEDGGLEVLDGNEERIVLDRVQKGGHREL